MNTKQSIAQQLAANESAQLNPLKLCPLVEFQAKKGIKIDEMKAGGSVPYPREFKDGERIIGRIDGSVQNGKFQAHGVTMLNGNTVMLSTEHFHQVEFKQWSNRFKTLAQFHQ